jgi:DNA uptake protein ComE-like DNA-binding protein
VIKQIKNFLTFSKKEQRGVIVLSAILIMLIITKYSLSFFNHWPDVDFTEFETEIEAFYQVRNNWIDSLQLVEKKKPVYYENISAKSIQRGRGDKPTKQRCIELNAADSADLLPLKGIGPVFASRIIKYRNLLGGFYSYDQLLEVYGMDSNRFIPLIGSISIDTNLIQRKNINKSTFKELLRHPYLDYDNVKAIMKYKGHSGEFNSIEEIRDSDLFSDSLWLKLRYYLTMD